MGNVECMGCERSIYRVFKGELEDLEVFSWDVVNCIYVAQEKDQLCSCVNSSEP